MQYPRSVFGSTSLCVCLAYHDQRKIPATDIEKDDLLQAGLGEKEIEIDDLVLGADEFRQQFPL